MNTPIDTIRQAYLLGWIKAARWANRDDLIDDIDSPAYTKDADAALAELERTQHTDLERKDALLRQVLAAYEQDEGLAMGRVVDAITSELSK